MFLFPLFQSVLAGCPDFGKKMSKELGGATSTCKKKVLSKGDKYYYIFFLGTHVDARGRGLCSQVVKHYQAAATKEQLPIYLEAGTEYCFKLYQKLGFVLVDNIKLGVGKCDEKGNPCKGGEGVTIRGMIWTPDSSAKGNTS